MAKRLSVIVSQAQGKNPAKRQLEEDIVAGLLFEAGIDVTIVPNLYDIQADSTSVIALKGVGGNAVLCSWLFERAARWVLDRHGVHGQHGTVLLQTEEEDEDEEEDSEATPEDKDRVIDSRDIPNRKIYCLDLKASKSADDFIAEVKRIHAENSVQVVGLSDVLNAAPLAPAAVATNERQRQWKRTSGTSDGATGGRQSNRRNVRSALVSGDRLQSLHELHGVHRLLFVWRVRCRSNRHDSGRATGQLSQRLSGVQSRVSRKRDHVSSAQNAGDRGFFGRRREHEDRSFPIVWCSG